MISNSTRIIAMTGSLILLVLILDLVRRRRLKEEYSLLWVLTAVIMFILAAWFELLRTITSLIGGVAASSTLFFFGLLFAFFMLLHFSVRVSALERRLTTLVQEVGLLRVRPPSDQAAITVADGDVEAVTEIAAPKPVHD